MSDQPYKPSLEFSRKLKLSTGMSMCPVHTVLYFNAYDVEVILSNNKCLCVWWIESETHIRPDQKVKAYTEEVQYTIRNGIKWGDDEGTFIVCGDEGKISFFEIDESTKSLRRNRELTIIRNASRYSRVYRMTRIDEDVFCCLCTVNDLKFVSYSTESITREISLSFSINFNTRMLLSLKNPNIMYFGSLRDDAYDKSQTDGIYSLDIDINRNTKEPQSATNLLMILLDNVNIRFMTSFINSRDEEVLLFGGKDNLIHFFNVTKRVDTVTFCKEDSEEKRKISWNNLVRDCNLTVHRRKGEVNNYFGKNVPWVMICGFVHRHFLFIGVKSPIQSGRGGLWQGDLVIVNMNSERPNKIYEQNVFEMDGGLVGISLHSLDPLKKNVRILVSSEIRNHHKILDFSTLPFDVQNHEMMDKNDRFQFLVREFLDERIEFEEEEEVQNIFKNIIVAEENCGVCGASNEEMVKCGRCMKATYCSEGHRKEGWKVHESVCVYVPKKMICYIQLFGCKIYLYKTQIQLL